MRVRLEDDPYKTRVYGTTPQFFVKQILTLNDASGNFGDDEHPIKNSQYGIMHSIRNRA